MFQLCCISFFISHKGQLHWKCGEGFSAGFVFHIRVIPANFNQCMSSYVFRLSYNFHHVYLLTSYVHSENFSSISQKVKILWPFIFLPNFRKSIFYKNDAILEGNCFKSNICITPALKYFHLLPYMQHKNGIHFHIAHPRFSKIPFKMSKNFILTPQNGFSLDVKRDLLKICERHDAESSIMHYPHGEDLKIIF